ncbi:putative zinc-binding metallopeptidase [Hyunsoonleella sp. 2307UL5-6]|uniref:zinc-binding metallopeptidase family protein n=1 Tax=Hyunsoonleella sp. 2307UL5-6 TaxID=3384768 RepID=UPI0039BD11D5
MKIFKCPSCSSTVFFENTQCLNCKNTLGYHLETNAFAVPQTYNSSFTNNLKFCYNHKYSVCNWLIAQSSENKFCVACSLNRKVPTQSDEESFKKWQKLEIAKHRLIYQLSALNLPLHSKIKNYIGIAFDFLSDNNKEKKLTGHSNGVITILLSEADSVHREQLKKQMDERYRTLLGHFRHEIGHYYWMLLFDNENLQKFRNIFGNENIDYGESLERYYKNGAPSNWNSNYISKYASAHPWEDWAETWAHYLHIMDTLETANSLGMSFSASNTPIQQKITTSVCPNPYKITDFKVIFDASIALTCAANSLNRSMGLQDIYPFVIPSPVYKKLEFIHNILKNRNNS